LTFFLEKKNKENKEKTHLMCGQCRCSEVFIYKYMKYNEIQFLQFNSFMETVIQFFSRYLEAGVLQYNVKLY